MDRSTSRLIARSTWVLTTLFFATFDITVRSQAPTSFQQSWESGIPVTVTGVVTAVFSDDFANHRSTLAHMIRDTQTGQSFELRFDKAPPKALQPGVIVTVSGRARGSQIYLLADQTDASITTAPNTQTSSQATATVSGDQTTLVILANFSDKSLAPTIPGGDCSAQAICQMMFTDPNNYSVDALYRETSFGKVSFSGSVVGPYTINYSASGTCDIYAWATAADAAAAADADLSAFARKVYVMPGNSNCGAAGTAELGTLPSRAWVFACDWSDVYAHELGHNLGMRHASSPTDEYGDATDVMGGSRDLLRQVNAPHKVQMGWLPDSQSPAISQDGQYSIAPLEADPTSVTAPQALRAFKSDTDEYYYLSYRRGIGFDANLCCVYLDRLSVHRWSGAANNTYVLAELADGETYTDPATGFTVTQASHDAVSSTAVVHVGAGCGSAAPSVTISPQSQSGSAGTGVTYDVSLQNNDSAFCASSAFSLAGTVPAGWTGSLSAASLQLAPGASGHATLSVVAPTTAPAGTYGDSVTISDPNVAAHAASVAGSFTVLSACPRNPLTVAIAPSSQSASAGTKLNYSMTLTNNDGSTCGATTFNIAPSVPGGWMAALSSSSVNLGAGASATVTYSATSPSTAAPATYGVSAAVSDGINPAHNASALASYVIPAGDSTAPTAPAGLTASVKRQQVALSWNASTDNVAVTGYQVLRNGGVLGTTTSLTWLDQPAAGSTSTYAVRAFDAAGNVSASSSSVVVTLTSGGGKKK